MKGPMRWFEWSGRQLSGGTYRLDLVVRVGGTKYGMGSHMGSPSPMLLAHAVERMALQMRAVIARDFGITQEVLSEVERRCAVREPAHYYMPEVLT